MTRPKDWLDDYMPVEERISAFLAEHPAGSLQSVILEHTSERVTVQATAFRDADDRRPGIGHSSLAIPGSTGFTKGSELENAETSAWGRALKALGYGIGPSREEVASKVPESRPLGASASYPSAASARERNRAELETMQRDRPAPVPRTSEEDALLNELVSLVTSHAQLELLAEAVQVPKGRRANAGELRAMIDIASKPASEPASWPEPGSAAHKALSPYERARAKAWHQERARAQASEEPKHDDE